MPYARLPDGKTLHYRDSKPSNDDPIRETFIFTHGLGSSQNYYSPLLPAFTSSNFRCISFDTSGAARSPYNPSDGAHQSVPTLSSDLLALMDYLSVPKAIVVGHSMGGMVAAHLAATAPTRIVASVWIGPVYPSPNVAKIFDDRIQAVMEKGMEAMADTVPYAAPAASASPLVRSFIRELLLGQDVKGYVSHCKVIAEAAVPDYAGIRSPVLLIAGEEDKSAPLEGCERMFGETGSEEKRMEVLERVGHWHCVEASEEVAKMVIDWYHSIQ
ncbi:hypothetical protein LTS18_013907 [Coniosporium uncinatum]|uniref:Uncharacterized protein n=1 Tax=Coniosporium uncinatum TaxID=93489 RepID=A0ACC3DHZ2_9PEZI|nr:hypothetical protein LTS18_013907 [Coniosporium uncinatum]